MAGDWIKMREDLHEDPAVLWMSQQLSVRPETIVGFCHRFWGLVSRQTCDGLLVGPTLSSLGNVIGLPGFPELLMQAGWLDYDESDKNRPVVMIPKFERHLSESAKKRALAAERKKQERDKREQKKVSRSKRDKSHTKNATREENTDSVSVSVSGSASESIFDSLPNDLSDTSALFDWFKNTATVGKAKPPGLGRSKPGFRKLVRAAEHALRAGDNPHHLFRWIVGGGNWKSLKDDDDLKRADERIAKLTGEENGKHKQDEKTTD